jgi:AraC-like DNA-binding protein
MSKSNKANTPIYTIEGFRSRRHDLKNFDIRRLEDGTKSENDFPDKPHRHTGYVILFIVKGTGIHTIDLTAVPIKKHTIHILTPGQVHHVEASKDIHGFFLSFTLDFYLHYARERHFEKLPFFRSLEVQTAVELASDGEKALLPLFEEMLAEFNGKLAGREEVIRNLLDALLIRLSRYWKTQTNITGRLPNAMKMRKFVELIAAHYKVMKTPTAYARLLHLTPSYLNTLCRQSLNRTATDLIHDHIIVEAKRYLTYTHWGVKKVASELGFRDQNYFLRFFKRKTGLTPDNFRISQGEL